MDGTVLVADDDRTIRTVLTQALTRAGCKVHATSSLTTLMRWVGEGRGDAVITDVMMPDGNGIEMLPKIHEDRPELPVIVISAQNTIMTAIQANEAEAFDYLPKPFDLPDLMKRTARALDRGLTRRETGASVKASETETGDDLPMIGTSAVMQNLYRVVARVMNTDIPVLIQGESGTGKSLIARALHDFSDRRTLPFVTASLADFEEMDGPARLMARVKGGTLLIDEIADMPLEAQARLVRMMDAPGAHVPRFLATTQVDLGTRLQAGQLREDLYYRLGGAIVTVPPLRDRVEDVLLLTQHFLKQAEADGLPARSLSADAEKLMQNYTWPGNVRQLENALRRLCLTSQVAEITRGEVELALGNQPDVQPDMTNLSTERLSASVERHLKRYFDLHGGALPPDGLYARILREIEIPLIEISLDATAGNQAKCADLLGINRNTLRKKIKDHDIRVTRGRKLM